MNGADYVKNVLVTEARDFSPLQERFSQVRNIRFLHGVLGLSSEMSEIQEMALKVNLDETNLKEEMGDLYWYMGIMVDELKADSSKIFTNGLGKLYYPFSESERREGLHVNVRGLVVTVGNIADLIKKHIMYGKALDETTLTEELVNMDTLINGTLMLYDMNGGQSRERNIEKLRARYGEKFTEAAALERNLTVEREILEKK